MSKSLKIALVSPYDFAYPGGVIAHISHLAHQFVGMGHEVKVLAPSSSSKNDEEEGLNVIPFGRPVPVPSGGSVARLSLSIWLWRRIRSLLQRESFDVVHIHEPLAPFLPLCILHLSDSINVGTFHAFHGSARLYGASKLILQPSFRKLDGRIAVSPSAQRFAGKHFPGDYQIIPNGINVDHFAKNVTPIPGLNDGKINILYVGRLEKRKGLKYLLAAFSRLKWETPNIRLVVVGPGSLDKDSHRVLSERNIHDVVFTGGVSNHDLASYYHAADIFCAPAIGKESFGIVLGEAMAAGKPIVATNIEGYAGVITDGREGILVPPKDEIHLAEALSTLIKDSDLREQLAAAGRVKVQEFRWDRVAGRVMDYYETLMGGSSASSQGPDGAGQDLSA